MSKEQSTNPVACIKHGFATAEQLISLDNVDHINIFADALMRINYALPAENSFFMKPEIRDNQYYFDDSDGAVSVEIITFDHLKGLDLDKIEALTSDNAKNCYRTGRVTFQELKGLTKEEIELFTSKNAQELYHYTSKITYKELAKALEGAEYKAKLLEKLSSKPALEAYRQGWYCPIRHPKVKCVPADFKDLTDEQFNKVTSKEALNLYLTGKVKPVDLMDLNEENSKKLLEERSIFTTHACNILSIEEVAFNQLLTLDHAQIYKLGRRCFPSMADDGRNSKDSVIKHLRAEKSRRGMELLKQVGIVIGAWAAVAAVAVVASPLIPIIGPMTFAYGLTALAFFPLLVTGIICMNKVGDYFGAWKDIRTANHIFSVLEKTPPIFNNRCQKTEVSEETQQQVGLDKSGPTSEVRPDNAEKAKEQDGKAL